MDQRSGTSLRKTVKEIGKERKPTMHTCTHTHTCPECTASRRCAWTYCLMHSGQRLICPLCWQANHRLPHGRHYSIATKSSGVLGPQSRRTSLFQPVR